MYKGTYLTTKKELGPKQFVWAIVERENKKERVRFQNSDL